METYKQRLDRLGKEAWSNAKDALRNLCGEFILPRPVDMPIWMQDYNIEMMTARKVCLAGDTLLILSSPDLSPENINWDDVMPSEVWSEDGDWDASWSGLMEIFDQVTEAAAEPKPKKKLYSVNVHYDIVLTVPDIEAESEEEALEIASEKASEMSLNEGIVCEENSCVTDVSPVRADILKECKTILRKIGIHTDHSYEIGFQEGDCPLDSETELRCADIDDDGDLYVIYNKNGMDTERIYEHELTDPELKKILGILRSVRKENNK